MTTELFLGWITFMVDEMDYSPYTVNIRVRTMRSFLRYVFLRYRYICAFRISSLEEAYQFAELVFPHLPVNKRDAINITLQNNQPIGEMIANQYVPETTK